MASPNCVFCKISAGQENTKILFENEEIAIFEDIKPAAKYHYLAIPKEHIKDGKSLTVEHKDLIEKLIEQGKNLIQANGGDVNDIRMGFHWPPFNSIAHLHMHLISPASEMKFLSKLIFKEDSYWFLTPNYVMNNILPKQKL